MQVLQKMRNEIPGTVALARDLAFGRGAAVISKRGVGRREGRCDGALGKPCRESCTEARESRWLSLFSRWVRSGAYTAEGLCECLEYRAGQGS
jgi:hypothetical protein